MNYVNYEKSIILKYHVKLVDWPDDVKFTNPTSLTSVEDLRKLRQALRTQTCHWVKLSNRDIKHLQESINAREAAGESVGRKRKRRSDKGKPKKKAALNPSDEEEGGEDEDGDDYETEDNLSPGPSSSQRQTRSKAAGRRRGPASKSRKVAINEDEDDEDEDNEPLGSSAAASTMSRRCTRSAKASTRRKFKSKEVILADEDMDDEAV